MHSFYFIHRDVKPENFLIGRDANILTIYAIDFGLAKRYLDPYTKRHISYRENKNLTGTARYASLNTHLGIEQSRRDDLESISLVLMYFLRGSLPWQGIPAKTKKQKYELIRDMKVRTPPKDLCKGYPSTFYSFLDYCRKLGFTDTPDYNYLMGLLKKLFDEEGYKEDFIFDWLIGSELEAKCRKFQALEEQFAVKQQKAGENGTGKEELKSKEKEEVKLVEEKSKQDIKYFIEDIPSVIKSVLPKGVTNSSNQATEPMTNISKPGDEPEHNK